MMRSSILGASTMLNVLIQHLPLQSLFWTKIWKAFSSLRSQQYRDAVDGPAVNAESPGAIFLWHKESGDDARTLALADEAAAQQVFYLLLKLRTLRRI